jgi:branched-chain amino acid transport system permease protein
MKNKLTKKKLILSAVTVILAALVLNLPYIATSNYIVRVFNMSMITYLVVLSVYVLLGMCGQNSFAQAGLWGVGAYVTANLTTKFEFSPVAATLVSILFTALFAFIIGFALFRLREFYFTFSTIGLMVILNSLFLNWTPVTGGAMGFSGIPTYRIFDYKFRTEAQYFYLLLAVAVIVSILIHLLFKSSLGRSFMAIRDNELAANCLGINSLLTKSISFAISGALCGLAGALYATMSGYLSSSTFTYNQSTMYLVMIMLGGTISPLGALIGGVGITLFQELLRPLENYMLLIFGAGIMIMMIIQPEGILGGGKALYAKLRKRQQSRIGTK